MRDKGDIKWLVYRHIQDAQQGGHNNGIVKLHRDLRDRLPKYLIDEEIGQRDHIASYKQGQDLSLKCATLLVQSSLSHHCHRLTGSSCLLLRKTNALRTAGIAAKKEFNYCGARQMRRMGEISQICLSKNSEGKVFKGKLVVRWWGN